MTTRSAIIPAGVEFATFEATVKSLEGEDPNGSFEAILSTGKVDRHGESVTAKALDPLPREIPIYHQHDWQDGATPVAKATPYYDGVDIKCSGTFAPTPRGQEIRQLVQGGFITAMSVGMTNTKRAVISGIKSVTSGDLFEASFTSIPVNTEATILSAKSLADLKSGARNSTTDASRLQSIHDLAVENGASCAMATAKTLGPNTKALAGSDEAKRERITDALSDANPDQQGDYGWRGWVIGVLPDKVVYTVGDDTFEVAYTDDGTVATITGDPTEVDIQETVVPDPDASTEPDESGSTTTLSLTAPAAGKAPAAQAAGADPAADEAAQAKARLRLLTAPAAL